MATTGKHPITDMRLSSISSIYERDVRSQAKARMMEVLLAACGETLTRCC